MKMSGKLCAIHPLVAAFSLVMNIPRTKTHPQQDYGGRSGASILNINPLFTSTLPYQNQTVSLAGGIPA